MKWRRGPGLIIGLVSMFTITGWHLCDPPRIDGAVLQNDSIVDSSPVAILPGFAANERAAAWLTATCDGNLTAVQVLWMSTTGGSGQTLGDSITISAAGSFPDPGNQLIKLVAPELNDGFFNEFTVVPPVPMITGATVVVDFRFFEAPPLSGPSLVTDIDGCQASKNGLFAIPPSFWFDACGFGLSGDFAIRAVLDCPEIVFKDGFESGDTTAWSSQIPQ